MLRYLKRAIFGRRKKNYYPRRNSLTINNNRRLNNLEDRVNNLMAHLKLTNINGTDLIVDEKDAKKFDKQFYCRS
jgi:hypothetical protein